MTSLARRESSAKSRAGGKAEAAWADLKIYSMGSSAHRGRLLEVAAVEGLRLSLTSDRAVQDSEARSAALKIS